MQKSGIVVFDIDGTLTDSVGIHQEAFLEAMESFEFPALRTDWTTYRHHSDRGIFEEAWAEAGFGGIAPVELLEERLLPLFEAAVARRPIPEIKEIDGAADMLSGLARTKWAVGFATGSLAGPTMAKLEALGIDASAEVVVTASEFADRDDIVGAAISRVGVRHGLDTSVPIISVGDGLWDLKTARALGLRFLGIGAGAKGKALREAEDGVPVFDDWRWGHGVLDAAR